MGTIINLKVVVSHLPTVTRIVDPVNKVMPNGSEIINVVELEKSNVRLSQVRNINKSSPVEKEEPSKRKARKRREGEFSVNV